MKQVARGLVPFLVLLVLASCSKDKGTAPQAHNQWEITVGGEHDDLGYGIVAVDEGNYIVTGETTDPETSGDVYLAGIDAEGKVLWENTSGGTGFDESVDSRGTDDGGVLCLGTTDSPGAMSADFFLVKASGNGDIQWSHTYGGPDWELAVSLTLIPGQGFLLGGSSGAPSPLPYVVMADNNGDVIWDTRIMVSTYGSVSCALPDADGGSLAIGWVQNKAAGSADIIIWKLDESGQEVSSRKYGGSGDDRCSAALRTDDDGLLLVGWTTSIGAGDSDVYVLRLDSEGNELWAHTYGGAASDAAHAVAALPDGGFVLAGVTQSTGAGESDAYVLKIDDTGALIWQRTYGGTGQDWARSVVLSHDGGLVIVGGTDSMGAGGFDVYVIKTDANGEL